MTQPVVNAGHNVMTTASGGGNPITLINVANVQYYGADITGATDSSTAIQAAIDAAELVNGTVYLPNGIYLLNTGLTIDSNINFVGDGCDGTILRANANINVLDVQPASSTLYRSSFRNFKIDGNAQTATKGILISRSTNSLEFRNIVIEDCWYGVENQGGQFNYFDNVHVVGDGSSSATSIAWYLHQDLDATVGWTGGNSNKFINCVANTHDVGIFVDGHDAPYWQASTAYSAGDYVYPTSNGTGAGENDAIIFECTTAGTSGGTEPTWDFDASDTTVDNTATWTARSATPACTDNIWLGGIIQGNTTCGLYQRQTDNLTTFKHCTFESIGGSGSVVIDTDHTAEDCVIQLEHAVVAFEGCNYSSSIDPGIVLQNESRIQLNNHQAPSLSFTQDDDSTIQITGEYKGQQQSATKVPTNIIFDADFKYQGRSALAMLRGHYVDRSIPNSAPFETTNNGTPLMPWVNTQGVTVSIPTISYDADADFGYARTIAYAAAASNLGNTSTARIVVADAVIATIGTECLCSFLIKSDADTTITYSAWQSTVASHELDLKADVPVMLFLNGRTIATNRANVVQIGPTGTDAPTLKIAQVQANYSDDTTWRDEYRGLVARGAFNPNQPDMVWRFNAFPTAGTWVIGDIVYDIGPTAAGNIGWVCTTAGTSGTWKTFGTIAA